MADIAKSSNQNYLPVQAYFNLDGTFNTFIGQGQPFVVSSATGIGINNTSVNTTVYPLFTSVTSGTVTAISISSSALSFNPSTGILSSTGFSGALSGTATTATNLAGGIASQIPYQTANGQTSFISNGANGQVLTSNGTSAPSWQNATANIGITDDTSSATTEYVTLARVTTGSISTLYTSSSKLSYVSQTGTLSATTFNGALASSNLTGTTLPSSIVSSSLTSVGTITSGVWNGTAIGNTYLANSSITINGNSVSLGGSTTVTANTTNALTIGTGLTGTSFNGSTAVTVAIDTGVVATLTGTQTLTNKTISGSTNTLTNIANGSLTNSAITINGTSTSLGGSINVGTVTSVSATAGTGISISGSPITTSGTLTITNTAPDQIVAITSGTGISVTGTYPNFTVTNTSPSSGGTVTNVTGTAPIVSSGGTTPAISITQATTSTNGYLSSTDWNTFNNKGSGSVTSVAASVPSFLSVTGSPITSSGTLAISYSGTALPAINGGTSFTSYATGDIIYASATNTLSKLSAGTNGYVLTLSSGVPSWQPSSGGGGGGSPAGSNTQVQYNNSGAFGASSGFTFTGNDLNIPFGTSNSATSSAKIALALSMIS